jgi:hypothetical protein
VELLAFEQGTNCTTERISMVGGEIKIYYYYYYYYNNVLPDRQNNANENKLFSGGKDVTHRRESHKFERSGSKCAPRE